MPVTSNSEKQKKKPSPKSSSDVSSIKPVSEKIVQQDIQAELQTVFESDPVAAAKAVKLKYVSDDKPGITRKKQGKKYQYFNPDGSRITDPQEIERCNKIGVPPAYKDVWICPNPLGHLQATGRDARGRKQYRYHQRWQETRGEDKFSQMLSFGAMLPSIRVQIEKDLKRSGMPREKVLAAVVKLLDRTHIRVGNEQYAKDNESYGLTTLLNEHVEVDGSKIHFEFKGKSGQEWAVDIKDKRLASIISQCETLPGQELFAYVDENGGVHDVKSDDVNAYLKEITGFEITAKYFRTWAGTIHAAMALQEFDPVETEAVAKKNIVQAVKQVAKRLGNTPAVCRKSYIHPHILNNYLSCKFNDCWQKEMDSSALNVQDGLTCEEVALLSVLGQEIVKEA